LLEKIKRVRPLDAAIVLVAVVLLAVVAYLGYSIWSQNRATRASAPISRAIGELQAMIKKNPKSVDLRLQLAQAYSASGMPDEAVAQYQAVLKLQKTNVTALTGLGFVTAQRKDWATSEKYWRQAITILDKQPNNKATKQYETANFYLANGLVVLPTYDPPRDEEALATLAGLFPGRDVVGIDCTDLVWGLGAFHCVTQQWPA